MNEQEYQFECDFSVRDDGILVTEDDGGQPLPPVLDRFPDNRIPTHLLHESILQARCNYSFHGHKKVANDPDLLADHLTVTLERRRLFTLLAPEAFRQVMSLLGESLAWFDGVTAMKYGDHSLHSHRTEIENGTSDMSRIISGYLCVAAYGQLLYVFSLQEGHN